MQDSISEREGRALFGADPNNYNAIRPSYPEQIYGFLKVTGALRHTVSTLEIGAGNGLATRRLLELGADPLTALEPDERFLPLLRSMVVPHNVEFRLIQASFEEAKLPPRCFDLVAAASSFHWIQPSVRLAKAAEILKPGGYLAVWWNVFGDPEREDPFHEATSKILEKLSSSPSGRDAIPFALDTAARRKEIMDTGAFEEPQYEAYRWTLLLSTQQVGALYATFSSIGRLPAEQGRAILDSLMEISERNFGGTVARNMVSPVYIARRKISSSWPDRPCLWEFPLYKKPTNGVYWDQGGRFL